MVYVADLALVLGLVAATFIDLEHLYIPDSITLGATVVGFATASLRPPLTFVEAGIGAVGGFLMVWLPFDLLYRKIRGRTGMAMGDAKLVMAAGAWFGIGGALCTLVMGAIQGTFFAIGSMLLTGKVEESDAVEKERAQILAAIEALPPEERAKAEAELADDPIFDESEGAMGARIAFGPFLALAMLEFLFFGDTLLEHYLRWVH
jgi:leader peptidase (prepilin peptidase)/N-methyltransferase